ncbi:MAG: hemerythrin domain-containing protein [Planctomycetes bacterium]|nr:hemerythrin domain-containing protein [Planctomycetota bacterium]
MRDYLECQAYVGHLRREHKRIHESLVVVERELQDSDSPSEGNGIRAGLTRLRETLVGHFEQEEQGGCLEEAVCCDPRLSGEVSEIGKQHPRILHLLDRLLKRADDCRTVDYRESFRQFAKVVHAHEAAENRILHTAFGTGQFEPNDSPSALGE